MNTSFEGTNCVILAAGEGKRMFSRTSKVLCEVASKPMVMWSADGARSAGIDSICVVISNPLVEQALKGQFDVCYQNERLGTGHAVLCAAEFLEKHKGEDTLILYGDAPFTDYKTMCDSLELHRSVGASATVISAELEQPHGYGRIYRENGEIAAIIEQADCNDKPEIDAIHEINSGAGWFNTEKLLETLKKIKPNNAQGEYYLTDAVKLLIADGNRVTCYRAETADVTLGANNPADLLKLNEIARDRIIAKHLANGVHFTVRDGIVISPDTEIAAGTDILPGTMLLGKCIIGKGCIIGPNTVMSNCTVGDNTHIDACRCYDSVVGNNCTVGPFTQIRPGSNIADGCKLGDFVEIKNSNIGEGTSVAHLTYIGDSDVGSYCNFGCGVVVVNYDGEKKNRTTVGDYAFIGCNTNLVSPVSVGNAAYTGAGTTVTKNIPDGALAVTRPELRIVNGWGARKLRKYIEKKNNLKK